MSFFGVPTRNGLAIGLGTVVVLGVDTGGASPSGFVVLPAAGSPSYSVTTTVLNSTGVSYVVGATVLSSSGTAYNPI